MKTTKDIHFVYWIDYDTINFRYDGAISERGTQPLTLGSVDEFIQSFKEFFSEYNVTFEKI